MHDWLGLLPHRPPMRLVAEVVAIEPGIRAVCRRPTAAGDWFFDGHFPGEPVVPAIVLVELLAQTGGLAIGSGAAAGEPLALRVAALGGFKFPGAATAGDVLEATARVVGRMGGLYKIEGEVTAGGRVVGVGSRDAGGGAALASPVTSERGQAFDFDEQLAPAEIGLRELDARRAAEPLGDHLAQQRRIDVADDVDAQLGEGVERRPRRVVARGRAAADLAAGRGDQLGEVLERLERLLPRVAIVQRVLADDAGGAADQEHGASAPSPGPAGRPRTIVPRAKQGGIGP